MKKEFRDKIESRNKLLYRKKTKAPVYLAITTGTKKGSYNLLEFPSYRHKNVYAMSWFNKRVILKNASLLNIEKEIAVKKNHIVNILVPIKRMKISEEDKISIRGRYVNANIDDVISMNRSYCIWLRKWTKTNITDLVKGAFYEYIMSEDFLEKIYNADTREDWDVQFNKKQIVDIRISKMLIGRKVKHIESSGELILYVLMDHSIFPLLKTSDKKVIEKLSTENNPTFEIKSANINKVVVTVKDYKESKVADY